MTNYNFIIKLPEQIYRFTSYSDNKEEALKYICENEGKSFLKFLLKNTKVSIEVINNND